MAVDPAALRQWLEDSCQAQGVPLRVSDPVVVASVGALLGGRIGGGATRSGGPADRPLTAATSAQSVTDPATARRASQA